jgi:hypothetical protein
MIWRLPSALSMKALGSPGTWRFTRAKWWTAARSLISRSVRRLAASTKPSTFPAKRSICVRSTSPDSSVSPSTSVAPAALARRSAPRMVSKKWGLVMSGTSIARVAVRPDCRAEATGLGR